MSGADKARAYRTAVYHIYPDAETTITFRVGEQSAALADFLGRRDAASGVFVSAYNPHGTTQPPAKNAEAHLRLRDHLTAKGWMFCDAAGGHAQSDETEPAVFVLHMDRQTGLKLARQFGQEALVHVIAHGAPELVWC